MAKSSKRFIEYMIPDQKKGYIYVYPDYAYTEYIKQSRSWTDKELKEAVRVIAKRAQTQLTAAKKAGYTRFLPFWARDFKTGVAKLDRKQTQRLLNKALVILQGGYTKTALAKKSAVAEQKRVATFNERYGHRKGASGIDWTDKHFWEMYHFLRREYPAYSSEEALSICISGYKIYSDLGSDLKALKSVVFLYESGLLAPQSRAEADKEAMENESDFEENPFD